MINQTPSDLDKFPVPVAGQKIPRGWFGRLVRFINSLILHGDGQYLTVKHTLDGQTITPTPALLQALGNGGAPPAAGGGSAVIGFPNYFSQSKTQVRGSESHQVTSASWLIGYVGVSALSSSIGSATLTITDNASHTYAQVPLFNHDVQSSPTPFIGVSVGFLVPIPPNCTIYITLNGAASLSQTYLYPCI